MRHIACQSRPKYWMIYLPVCFDLGGPRPGEPATNIINEFNDKEIDLSNDCHFW